MANSILLGPTGLRVHDDAGARSPFSNTPGPLGINDWADPDLLGNIRTHEFLAQSHVRSGQSLIVGTQARAPVYANQVDSRSRITLAQLKRIFPLAESTLLADMGSELNRDLQAYGLDTALRRAHFFAQVREESGSSFQAKVENLNYRPEALKRLFQYYREHPDEATADGRVSKATPTAKPHIADQEKIANNVYAERNGNGEVASGDGWTYRGRGLIQVTGRANYAAIAKQYRNLYAGASIDFETTPQLMSEFPYSVRSAVCFWVGHRLHKLADHGHAPADVDRITAVVNLRTDSYENRRNNFTVANHVFS